MADEIVDDLEDFGDNEGETPEAAKPEAEAAAAVPEWKAELDKRMAESERRTTETLSTFMEGLKGLMPKPATPTPEPAGDDDMTNLWALAKDNPALMQAIIEKQVEVRVGKAAAAIKGEVNADMERRQAGEAITGILANYRDDIAQGSNSAILRAQPGFKAALAKLLDPSMVGSQQHEQLAYALAAAANPKAVSKHYVEHAKTREAKRMQQAQRLTALAGLGRSPSQDTEPEITDKDLDLARTFGIDLANEKVAGRIKQFKSEEGMPGYGGGDIVDEGVSRKGGR
jgi:hypothetical protein